MADLDTATDFQYTLAVWCRVACDHVAYVCNQVWLGQVAAPVHPGGVELGPVRAHHEIAHGSHSAVGDNAYFFSVDSDRPEETGRTVEVVANFFFRRKAKSGETG